LAQNIIRDKRPAGAAAVEVSKRREKSRDV
jgi:hypothetical protein